MSGHNLTISESEPKIIVTQEAKASLIVTQSGGDQMIITPEMGGEVVITTSVQNLHIAQAAPETVIITEGDSQTLVITETGDGCAGCPDYAGPTTDATDGRYYYYSWTHKDTPSNYAAQRYDSDTKEISDLFNLTTQPTTLAEFEALSFS